MGIGRCSNQEFRYKVDALTK